MVRSHFMDDRAMKSQDGTGRHTIIRSKTQQTKDQLEKHSIERTTATHNRTLDQPSQQEAAELAHNRRPCVEKCISASRMNQGQE